MYRTVLIGASVGAFVASTNSTCTRFYSRVIYNRTAQELMDGLQQCMRGKSDHSLRALLDLLSMHFRFAEGIPSREQRLAREKYMLTWVRCWLINFDFVFSCPLSWWSFGWTIGNSRWTRAAADHRYLSKNHAWLSVSTSHWWWKSLIGEDYSRPKLAVVIVKKKGNARFFAKMGSTSMVNPPPGTIIDHTVTNGKNRSCWTTSSICEFLLFLAEWYDFYLISQCARQGTVAPTHYNVIWDRTKSVCLWS